jgi:tetratricopeptide (TPR) repeat protein
MRPYFEERNSRVAESTAWAVVAGLAGVLGIGALFRDYLRKIVEDRLPPGRLSGLIRQRDLPLPAGERFVVLIADLQGDDDKRTHTRHVAAALEPYRGLEVVPVGPGPEWGIESRDAFEAKARALLAKRRGDVLISGDVATAAKGLRLRILPSDARISTWRETPKGRRPGEYTLTETGLPLDFDQDFNAVLVALVATSVAPATERQGHYLVDVLEPAANRLINLCADVPADLDQDQRGNLWHALGIAAYVLGEQSGQSRWLEHAVAALRATMGIWTRERVPQQWAGAQNNLGTALRTLGEREDGTERLEQAVEALRATLEVYSRERVPLDWAMTQNNLGNALRILGVREEDTGRLKQAVQAYRAALAVWTRERVPLDWAGIQNNLGNALLGLGTREEGTGRLEEAVSAYRAALAVRTRERYPFLWALTQENVGLALMQLGVRQGSVRRLEEAVDTISGALAIFESAEAKHNVNKARASLARAEALLTERRGTSAAE